MSIGLVVLLAVIASYWLGRQEGLKLGEERGKAIAPLELREQALRGGLCPVCMGTMAATIGENCQVGATVVE